MVLARQYRIYTLWVQRAVGKSMWIGIGARSRDSTVDIHDENEMTINVSFTSWSF